MKKQIHKRTLKDICKIEKGKVGITKAVQGKYPLFVTAEERLSHNEWHFNEPATIVPLVSSTGHGHASMKRLHYAEGEYAVGNILATLIPEDHNYLSAKYLYVYLTINKDELLVSQMTGAANVTLTITRLGNVEIEVPDYDKQLEIVQRYNDYENYKSQMSSHIENRSELIESLRQQILQDAITGKLSEEWRKENQNIESAEILLEKIKKEKEKLIKEGKIKKQKALPPITEEEMLFGIPNSWVWCRLGEITNINPRNYIPDTTKISFIPMRLIEDGYVSSHSYEERYWREVKKGFTHFQENDLLVSKITPCFENRKSVIAQGLLNKHGAGTTELHVVRMLSKDYIDIRYLLWLVKTEKFIQEGVATFSGTAGQQRIGKTFIENYIVPLPPLFEQQYIVDRIESLFTKLDKIKELNTANKNNIDLLNQVVLKEIFESNND